MKRAIITRIEAGRRISAALSSSLALLASLALLFLALAIAPNIALAQDGADGLYRKWDSEVQLAALLGGGFAQFSDADGSEGLSGAGNFALSLRFLDAFGPRFDLSLHHEELFLHGGLEIRPLGPAHFLQNLSTGRARLDLFIRSPGFTLGSRLYPDARFYWQFGLGAPLILPHKRLHGLDLRLEFRHQPKTSALRNTDGRGEAVYELYLLFDLSIALGGRPLSG